MTINTDLCYIQNRVIMNSIIKRSSCHELYLLLSRHQKPTKVQISMPIWAGLFVIGSFRSLASTCGYAALFVSDLVGTWKAGFLTKRLVISEPGHEKTNQVGHKLGCTTNNMTRGLKFRIQKVEKLYS